MALCVNLLVRDKGSEHDDTVSRCGASVNAAPWNNRVAPDVRRCYLCCGDTRRGVVCDTAARVRNPDIRRAWRTAMHKMKDEHDVERPSGCIGSVSVKYCL